MIFCFGFLKGLDFVIAEARRYGIKLILSLANNYDSFGGKKQYVNWARNQGQYLTSDDDFFRNPVVKGYYKNHIKVNERRTFFNFLSLILIYSCFFDNWYKFLVKSKRSWLYCYENYYSSCIPYFPNNIYFFPL